MSTLSMEQEFVSMLPAYDRLLARMARGMWALAIVMGLMIVVAAFVIGVWNSGQIATYFSHSKEVREAAATGTTIVSAKVSIESIFAWLPGFKFFGMGLLFSGITFVLANIINALRAAGAGLQRGLGVEVKAIPKPWQAKLFPPLMMMGLMILIGTFLISLWLAGVSAGYWNHSIKTELDAAQTGSALLSQLATIQSVKAWLEPLKFAGIALLLTGISLALATIRKILQFQAGRVLEIVSARETRPRFCWYQNLGWSLGDGPPGFTKARPSSANITSKQDTLVDSHVREVDSSTVVCFPHETGGREPSTSLPRGTPVLPWTRSARAP